MTEETELLYAYFAGAIEADGYITIQRIKKKKHKHHYFCAGVGFTGTGAPLVQNLLKKSFGGGVYSYTPKNPNHKTWHSWQTSGSNKVYTVLEKLTPYLVTKRKQASLTLEFIDLARNQWAEIKKTQKPPYRVTESMLAKRKEFWAKVKLLNAPRNKKGAQVEAAEYLASLSKKNTNHLLDGKE